MAGASNQKKLNVLLVDDEEMVRKVIRSMLVRQGHAVWEAGEGREAIRIWQANREKIDVLLTDVVMPDMDGGEIAERLSTLKPSLKVIFMSGYAEPIIDHLGVTDNMLQKPFTYEALAEKLGDAAKAAG